MIPGATYDTIDIHKDECFTMVAVCRESVIEPQGFFFQKTTIFNAENRWKTEKTTAVHTFYTDSCHRIRLNVHVSALCG